MRATGLAGGDAEYLHQLNDWLERESQEEQHGRMATPHTPPHPSSVAATCDSVSVRQQVPAVLLVLSRALMLAGPLAAPPPLVSSL